MPDDQFNIPPDLAGQTLAAALRRLMPGQSWSRIKQLIAKRHVLINGSLCLDEARRLHAGETVQVHQHSRPQPPGQSAVAVVYLEEHLVVVDKPAGLQTLRRHEELHWSPEKKALQPTLDELLLPILHRRQESRLTRLYDVHRLDRDTSGLMLFALNPQAQQKLIALFKKHQIQRTYLALVVGHPAEQTIESWLVRDRGDGLRGSSPRGADDPEAERAVTHIRPVRRVGPCSLIECRLGTGRTHQIRIHLAEIGHPLCGEKLYTHPLGHAPIPDPTRAPRQALHSADLRFTHPMTGQVLHYKSDLPADLQRLIS